MKNLSPKDIIRNVSNVQLVNIPPDWMPETKSRKSVFVQLYEWIVSNKYCAADQIESLHNLVYVGDKRAKSLMNFERKRLSNFYKPDELERALSWSDADSGPVSKVMDDLGISGDVILIIPQDSKEAMGSYFFEELKKIRAKEVAEISAHAAGTTFPLWLKCQRGRPDGVGDLIEDVLCDDGFPEDLKTYWEYEDYMIRKVRACDAAIECLKIAWKEYAAQYPERIRVGIPCHCIDCNELVGGGQLILAVDEDSDEVISVHRRCFDDNKYGPEYRILHEGALV